MVERFIFRAECRPDRLKYCKNFFSNQRLNVERMISDGKILTLCISTWETHVFLYYECQGKRPEPDEIFEGAEEYLEVWPGEEEKRFWVPMIDIFHYNAPASLEQWSRKTPVTRWPMRIARLKPEMVCSYIFYHYQLQEEKPGYGSKYGIIAIHENLLFFYIEEPYVEEGSPYQGKLQTANSPEEWGAVMDPHFINWPEAPEGQDIWKNIETVLAI